MAIPESHPREVASEAESAAAGVPSLELASGWLERGYAVLNSEETIVSIDDWLSCWLGQQPHRLVGRSLWDCLEDRCPEWRDTLGAVRAETIPVKVVHLAMDRLGAKSFYVLESICHPGGRTVRLSSALPPAAELREASWDEHLGTAAARRELFVRCLRSEAQVDNLVRRWPGVIFTQRADLSFLFVSQNIQELVGIAPAEWCQQPQCFWQVLHEGDQEEFQQSIRRSALEKRSGTSTFRVRHARTGRVSYLLEYRQAVATPSGLLLGYEGVWLDVTRQVIAEKRLSSAAWKETLAVLTMGLAHDFSNIMAGIVSLSETILSQLESGHPFCEGMSLIKQNSLQAHQLVHKIIHLHHGKTGTSQYCDLNELVQELVDLVKKILPRRITITTENAPDSLPLYVDPVDFRQVIINLTLNAAEAMPQGGQLSLKTSRHEVLPEMPILRGVAPRLPAVRLTVQDTGCGIKPRHLASIFDPFFTTKAMNKGSGLGLYNARLFVEKQSGCISVDSMEGVGTTFHLWLPEADFTEADRAGETSATQRRSLLVVGRADGVLDSTAEFWRCHDYHVVAAASEGHALDLLESGEYQFAAMMVVAESRDRDLLALFAAVRQRGIVMKNVLQLVGCHSDEMETSVLQMTDLVIVPDLAENEIVDRLKRCLPEF